MDQLTGKINVTEHVQYHTDDELSPSNVKSSPLDQFRIWFLEAVKDDRVHEPEAITLATATPSGVPSARMVLFKTLDARGFVFYTNYTSRKSAELLANPRAALVFYWREMHRSVRVVGAVEKVKRDETAVYWSTRPVGSRLGAWASKQSAVVGDREVHDRLKKMESQFGSGEDVVVPLPEFWGGWRVLPDEVEFWSGKPSRLHDRVRYLRVQDSDGTSQWRIDRLAP